MIGSYTQDNRRIFIRFNDETKFTEVVIADKDATVFPDPLLLDYKEVDQFAHNLDRMSLAYNQAIDAEVVVALEGFGIKQETSPDDPERRDLVSEAMEKVYGPRCRHPEPGCLACEAYRQLDAAIAQMPMMLLVQMGGSADDGNLG